MTAKELINAKPALVQEVLKMRMTRQALRDDLPDWDAYGIEALSWWHETVMLMRSSADERLPELYTEEFIAKLVLRKIRERNSVWNRIHGGVQN